MKFNLMTSKENGRDINLTLEISTEEVIASMKQSSEDLRTLLLYKDEIVDAIKSVIGCVTENSIKVREQEQTKEVA